MQDVQSSKLSYFLFGQNNSSMNHSIETEEHTFDGKSIDISPVPVIKTSPMVVDDLQMVNNALSSLGYEALPVPFECTTTATTEQDNSNTNSTLKILKTIQKLTSQRRRDISLIESTSNRLKSCNANRKRLSSDKSRLLLQVQGLESDLKNVLIQMEAKDEKYRKEKKMLIDIKNQLEKRCARLQTRDTSYQAKLRKKEVEYEKLKERLQNKQYNDSNKKLSRMKKRNTNNKTISTISYGSIILSENVEPANLNTFHNHVEETECEKAKSNDLTSIVNDMYIEKQKELLSENGRYKLQISNMEAQLKELQRIVNEQELLLRSVPHMHTTENVEDETEYTDNSNNKNNLGVDISKNVSPVVAESNHNNNNDLLNTSNIDWEQVHLNVDLNGIENM